MVRLFIRALPLRYKYFSWRRPQLYPYYINVFQPMKILHEYYCLNKNTIGGIIFIWWKEGVYGIESEMSLHVGIGGSCNMILWERSYWFSMRGRFFVGFCFWWNWKTVWQNTLKSLSQLLTTPPKLTKSLPIGKITKRKKKVNWDKTKIGVGNSATMKVREINEKTKEGEIIRIRKDLVGCLVHIFPSSSFLTFVGLCLSSPYRWRSPVDVLHTNKKSFVLCTYFLLDVA